MEQRRRSGKLAVILHADVAGSTALVQQDEDLAHERIQETFQRFSNTITKYHGRVRELRGDALLAEFERASGAVSAALAFQADHKEYITNLNDPIQPTVRVGIAMGEVVIADKTITGEGVVLAQRLEQLAEPGEVVIQAVAHETIPSRFPFDYADLGEHEVKGFDKPVHAYSVSLKKGNDIPSPEQGDHRVRNTIVAFTSIAVVAMGIALMWFKPWEIREELASIERMAFPLPDKPSIAVLPFTNMSDDPQQEYFVDGMTEDLITDLSKISGLFVIARNSSFTYKGKAVDVKNVARDLGVRYVLEGSVRRVGNQVRINTQLIDATTGGHLWAERYDGSLDDVFTLQDHVTQQIVSALALNLTEGTSAAAPKTISAQAYDAFLKGWSHYQRHGAEDLKEAIPHLEQAIQLDSAYAQAQAALAAVYWEIWSNGWADRLSLSSAEAMTKTKQHLEQAMKEPTPLAHWLASNIQIAEGDYQKAVSEAEQIVALDSNNATGYAQLANALELSGKSEESAEVIQRAIRLDPHTSPLHVATDQGDVDAVRKLISDGNYLDPQDHFGRTPLHVAAEKGQVRIAELLIEAGADINKRTNRNRSRDLWGFTPLMLAAANGSAGIAELLISNGVDIRAMDLYYIDNRTALHVTAEEGHVDVAEVLLAAGADINATTAKSLATPLILTSKQGHEAMVEMLIEKGADVTATDINGITPLHNAGVAGDLGVVRLLLANGSNVNATTKEDWTPLHVAAFEGNVEAAELLLDNGAGIDARSERGYTPLRRAAQRGHESMILLLIRKDADINTRDSIGVTPLHSVALSGHDLAHIAELLINEGADVNAKDNLGSTPLDYATSSGANMKDTIKKYGGLCAAC